MRAIIFDVDDTLYDQVIPFQKAYDELFKGCYEISVEELYKRSRHFSDEVFEATQRGEMSMEKMYIYRVQKAFESLEILVSDEEALKFQDLYATNQKKLELSKTMIRIMNLCQENQIRLGIITNGPSNHQWNKVEALRVMEYIPREFVFVSGDIGVAKPHLDLFNYVKEKMDLIPQETLLVGDTFESDIVGANMAGWQTVWLKRRQREMPEGEVVPNFCVRHEEELYDVIVKWIEENKE